MANLKKTIRMCIFCKNRNEQKSLLRLKCENKKLVLYDGYNRSFYICCNCIALIDQDDIKQKDQKRINKALCKQCKNKDNYLVELKEILTYVR